MAPDSKRQVDDPDRPRKARTKHAGEREERKERGTPEKTRGEKSRRHGRDPDSPRKSQSPRKSEVVDTDRQAREQHKSRQRSRERRKSRSGAIVSEKHRSHESSSSSSGGALSTNALAQLDALNAKQDEKSRNAQKKRQKPGGRERYEVTQQEDVKKRRRGSQSDERRRVSGPLAEEGLVHSRSRKTKTAWHEYENPGSDEKWLTRKKLLIILACVAALLAIIIPVSIILGKKNKNASSSGGTAYNSNGDPSNGNLNNVDRNSIPASAKNTILDPFIWYDTADFNLTYTDATVGGLSIMGLNSAWDDSKQANSNTPPLNKPWSYGKMPIRGINIGGWLAIEPFITPSIFNEYKSSRAVVDEWTLTAKLGPSNAAATLEKHYAKYITAQDFADIQAAGFDHVRIPFSYWAVTTYPGDPYVPQISWRYLLRAIEYARQHGLRVNLDLHGLPGSQNGWNHSGRQGSIGWLNGTDGDLNADRSLAVHSQLSTFFAQPRYSNIITIYGLANEPKMTQLDFAKVVNWTTTAVSLVRANGIKAHIAFGDGFLGLTKWQGQFSGQKDLLLDAHQYIIFDPNQIALTHERKIQYACNGFSSQMQQSVDQTTGFGATVCGEWSQADTDCAPFLNNVGAGTRWEGTLQSSERSSVSVLTPACPGKSAALCSCAQANADPSSYSDAYRRWLKVNAEAQMHAFEQAWGWFYWTWKTEAATQWDYRAGMANGILPKKTWDRQFDCSADVPTFDGLSESY